MHKQIVASTVMHTTYIPSLFSSRLPAANIRSRDGLCTSAASGADMGTTLPQGRSIANETMAADPATKDQQPTHLVVLGEIRVSDRVARAGRHSGSVVRLWVATS